MGSPAPVGQSFAWPEIHKRTEGETVPTLKEVIRQTVPRTLHGRPAKVVGRKTPLVEPPPRKPPPQQVDRTLAQWTAARDAGDVVTARRLLEGLRKLAERPHMRELGPGE